MVKNRVLRLIWRAFVVFSVSVTLALALLIVTNYHNLGRALYVISLIKAQALEPVTADQLINGAVKGMVEALEDPYSVFLEAREYQNLEQHITGSYGGIGLLIGLDEEKRLVVISPFKGTPAHRAGILAGDFITKIDGQDTTGMELDKAARLMQGAPGTQVRITIMRKGEKEPREFTLTRETIEIPSVEGQVLADYPGIGYINLTTFNERTGRDLGKLLEELKGKGARALILDLRNNPGGYLGAAIEVADYFVPEGPIVYIVDRYRSTPYMADKQRIDLPLAVLVNKGTASASEIVAGAIKDSGAGIVIGEKTFGKGLVQTVFELAGGAALKLTTAKYLTPGKHDINKKGIEPDIVVPLDAKNQAYVLMHAPDTKNDPQLKKAIEVLKSKLR